MECIYLRVAPKSIISCASGKYAFIMTKSGKKSMKCTYFLFCFQNHKNNKSLPLHLLFFRQTPSTARWLGQTYTFEEKNVTNQFHFLLHFCTFFLVLNLSTTFMHVPKGKAYMFLQIKIKGMCFKGRKGPSLFCFRNIFFPLCNVL